MINPIIENGQLFAEMTFGDFKGRAKVVDVDPSVVLLQKQDGTLKLSASPANQSPTNLPPAPKPIILSPQPAAPPAIDPPMPTQPPVVPPPAVPSTQAPVNPPLPSSGTTDPPAPPVITPPAVVTRTILGPKDDLQAAINNTAKGDIWLQSGAQWIGSYNLRMRKTGDVVRIISSGKLPVEGVRVDPLRDRAELATIISPNEAACITNDYLNPDRSLVNVHHYDLIGLECTVRDTTPICYNIVSFGNESASGPDDTPHHINLSHCYIHGLDKNQVARAYWPGGRLMEVRDCNLSNIHSTDMEPNAIGSDRCIGDILIQNCYLEGGAENVMFGVRDGAAEQYPGMLTRNIKIRYNFIAKPLAWRSKVPHDFIKNLLEFKMGQFIEIYGNLLEYSWQQSQNGFAVLFTPRSTGGKVPTNVVSDVLFSSNIVRHANGGMIISGLDENTGGKSMTQSRRIKVFNNLFDDISAQWAVNPKDITNNMVFAMGGQADVEIDHNTSRGSFYGFFQNNLVNPQPPLSGYYKITNNDLDCPKPFAAQGDWGPTALPPGTEMHGNLLRQWATTTEYDAGNKAAWKLRFPDIDATPTGAGADLVKLKVIEDAVRSGDIRGLA